MHMVIIFNNKREGNGTVNHKSLHYPTSPLIDTLLYVLKIPQLKLIHVKSI